ncbi:hypothetical protein MTP04_24310 [Lysinibacillus sp. PLM2]|nr:hypothetical protein MTP04_24310 [Lysinibacillus sp. PLM2]
MEIRIQYVSQEDRDSIIAQHSDKILLAEENLIDGNYLIFGDEPRPVQKVYTQVDEEEFNKIQFENEVNKQAIAELTLLISMGGM